MAPQQIPIHGIRVLIVPIVGTLTENLLLVFLVRERFETSWKKLITRKM